MGLMQQAYKTYELAEDKYVGVYYADAKEPLAPEAHIITSASIEITIGKDGSFLLGKTVDKEDAKTIIPVTEESGGRTSSPAAHPLCEQIGYLLQSNEEKFGLYVNQLQAWINSDYCHPMLEPILNYVQQGTLLSDLVSSDVIKLDENGNVKDEKQLIRWRVEGVDIESACWKNRELHKAFASYYRLLIDSREKEICMVSGEKDITAAQHAKGVSSMNGNAKIISANDSNGFTYRGRFIQDAEALTISYVSSQKSHNALRWLIANQGDYIGKRCFLCWNPEGKKLPKATRRLRALRGAETVASYTPSDYKQTLRDTILGWQDSFAPNEQAVTAVFDAATTGRLSLVYYSEMQAKDFLDRLGFWDESCCWLNDPFGIQSPSLEKMAEYAFGTLRGDKFEADEAIKKQTVLRLLPCRLERAKIPRDVVLQLIQKAEKLYLCEKKTRDELLFITCAAIRKYRYDYLKEEWNMALEEEKQDRSYQFGRLLAIMEKIERDTYTLKDTREPNAMRRQAAFVSRPFATYTSIMKHLKNAYYPRLSPAGRSYYEKMIEQIMEILNAFEPELNKPLEDTYLLGYYLQKSKLYTNNKEKTEE